MIFTYCKVETRMAANKANEEEIKPVFFLCGCNASMGMVDL
jgi:hypothetical protein